MANGPAATETRHLRTLFAVGAAGLLTDGQLLERFAILQGDPAELAFAALVERHGPMVLRVARSTLRDESSAHDAFQATFLVLARKARSLWVRDSLGPWLHAVARRVASEARSDAARRNSREALAARPEAYFPEGRDRDDLARAIHQEIDRLPDAYRLAVETIHLEGLTQHEAAARLGWPVGTLQSRLARGRQKLRDRLERRGLTPSLVILAGKSTHLSMALAASTSRLALTVRLGQATAGVIAPAVLAMIETTMKGMLMTKLKFGALAAVMACGLAGAGLTSGVGSPVRAVDDRSQTAVAIEADRIPRADALTAPDEGIPQPASRPRDTPAFCLFEFYETESVSGLKHHEEFARLKARGYPVESADVAIQAFGFSPGRALAERYHLGTSATILVCDGGNEIDRLIGLKTPAEIAAFYNRYRAMFKSTDEIVAFINRRRLADKQAVAEAVLEPEELVPLTDPPKAASATTPIRSQAPVPRPLTTAVQILVPPRRGGTIYASGAIVDSNAERTIVLTAASIFEKDRVIRSPGGTITYAGDILVNLTEPEVKDPAGLSSRVVYLELRAKLLVLDRALGMALIAIYPGRELPASPVYQGPPLAVGAELRAMGSNPNGNVIAWPTQILNICADLTNSEFGYSYPALVGSRKMADWWVGGGLFAPDGHLAGIALTSDRASDSNTFARPEAIKRLLDRGGVRKFYQDVWADRDNEPLGRVPASEPASNPPPPAGAAEVTRPTSPPPASSPSRASTDRQRLDELERKLDQVLKALDALKPGKATETPKPVQPPET